MKRKINICWNHLLCFVGYFLTYQTVKLMILFLTNNALTQCLANQLIFKHFLWLNKKATEISNLALERIQLEEFRPFGQIDKLWIVRILEIVAG